MVPYSICVVRPAVFLLQTWVMLCMLLLMRILMLIVVHHRYATTCPVDTAMLPLMALTKHAVRRGVGRSCGGRGFECGSKIVRRSDISCDLVSWMMRLWLLWLLIVLSVVVSPSALREPEICHLTLKRTGAQRSMWRQ